MSSVSGSKKVDSQDQHVVSFAHKPRVRLLRALIPLAARVLPQTTARWCMNLFLTPGRQRAPSWELANQALASVRWIEVNGHRVKVMIWGQTNQRRKVLLCHGWGGRGLQLSEFAMPLVQKGFQVVAFDAIGHGESTGSWTDMLDYSSVIRSLDQSHGPFHACIGHSFGAGNVLYAEQQFGVSVPRIVLLACFDHGQWVVDTFARIMNVPNVILAHMKESHEKKRAYQLRWADFDMVRMAKHSQSTILLLHDKDDKEIPYEHSRSFVLEQDPRIQMHLTSGLGHRRILRSAPVIERICQFVCAE